MSPASYRAAPPRVGEPNLTGRRRPAQICSRPSGQNRAGRRQAVSSWCSASRSRAARSATSAGPSSTALAHQRCPSASSPWRAASRARRSAARPCPAWAARVHHRAASRSRPSRASSRPEVEGAVAAARLGGLPVPARGRLPGRPGPRPACRPAPGRGGGPAARPARTTPRTRSSRPRARPARAGPAAAAARPARWRAGRRPRRCRRPPRTAGAARRPAPRRPAAARCRPGAPRRCARRPRPARTTSGPYGRRRGPAKRMPRLKAASTLPASAALENQGSAPVVSPAWSSRIASALAASRCPA